MLIPIFNESVCAGKTLVFFPQKRDVTPICSGDYPCWSATSGLLGALCAISALMLPPPIVETH